MKTLVYKPLSEIAELLNGYAFKSKNYVSSGIRVIRIANVQDGCISDEKPCFYPIDTQEDVTRYMLKENDFLVSLTGNVGRVAILTQEFLPAALNQRVSCIRIKNEEINFKFLFYYFLRKQFQKDCIEASQGVAQLNLSTKWLEKYPIPVPPIEKQKRIVAKIEELFSELDNGVETLKKTKQQLAVYRQAVLKEAFEGRLTVQYRLNRQVQAVQKDFNSIKKLNPIYKDVSGDENEIKLNIPESWIKIRFGDVFDVEVGSTPSRRVDEYWNGDIPWVSSGEVHFAPIFSTEECITQEGLNNASTNVHPTGTIMLAMIGEGKTRGQAAILNIPAAHNQNTAAILVSKTPCQPKYIYYFLQMNYENTRRVGSGNNQKALNKERVRALRFPFASFEEQKLIVEEIENRLSVCDSIEQTVNTALQQAEAMRQSILKKAFEGEL